MYTISLNDHRTSVAPQETRKRHLGHKRILSGVPSSPPRQLAPTKKPKRRVIEESDNPDEDDVGMESVKEAQAGDEPSSEEKTTGDNTSNPVGPPYILISNFNNT